MRNTFDVDTVRGAPFTRDLLQAVARTRHQHEIRSVGGEEPRDSSPNPPEAPVTSAFIYKALRSTLRAPPLRGAPKTMGCI